MGAGAGYTVSLEVELNLKTLRVKKTSKYLREFEVELSQSYTDWEAEDYYNGVSSDGIYDENGFLYQIYSDDDCKILGGKITGTFDIRDKGSQFKTAKEYLKYYLPASVKIKTMYGRGWLHIDLPDVMVFTDGFVESSDYYTFNFDSVKINAPAISHCINEYFAHWHEVDSYFFGDE